MKNKREVDLLYIPFLFLCLIQIVLCFFPCIERYIHLSLPSDFPINYGISDGYSEIISCYPFAIVFSAVTVLEVLSKRIKKKNVDRMAVILRTFCSVLYTLQCWFLNVVEQVCARIGDDITEYNFAVLGIVNLILTWIIVFYSRSLKLAYNYYEHRAEGFENHVRKKSLVVSIIISAAAFILFAFLWGSACSNEYTLSAILIIVTFALIFYSLYFSIKLSFRKGKAYYIYVTVIIFLLSLIAVFFRTYIFDFFDLMTRTIVY